MGRGKRDDTLRREFAIRKDFKDHPLYSTAVVVTNYRNLFYNFSDRLSLTPSEVSVLLFAFPYRFFSREALKQRLRMGDKTAKASVASLIDKGYITNYSDLQIIEDTIYRESEVCNYTETIDKVLAPRLCLTYYGKKTCNDFFAEITKGVIAGYPYDERFDNKGYRFLY